MKLRIRRRRKHKKFKLLWFVLGCYLFYQVISYVLIDIKLVNGNEEFIKMLLQDSNYHLLYEKQNKNLISKFIKLINKIEINEPVSIVQNSFNSNDDITFSYMTNPIIEKPRVYIYSTHQGEEYSGKGLSEYNIEPGVMMASYLLQDRLNEMGIVTIVEERSVSEYLKQNNLQYKDCYQATRHFLKTTLEEYEDFDLVIDLHRDALSKDLSTVTIDGKDYAKVLFVMNPNYADNMSLVKRLNNSINTKYPKLSRGIYDGYRDTFNQDLNSNAILLEVGGQHNTVNEVVNTIDAIAEIIKENI